MRATGSRSEMNVTCDQHSSNKTSTFGWAEHELRSIYEMIDEQAMERFRFNKTRMRHGIMYSMLPL